MSNDGVIDELTYIAKLLYELPQAICDEMEKREGLKKQQQIKDIQANLDFYATNINEINKMMYGYTNDKVGDNNGGTGAIPDIKTGFGQDEASERVATGEDYNNSGRSSRREDSPTIDKCS